MKLSSRELLLGWVSGVVILLGLTYWVVEPRVKTWKELSDKQGALEQQIKLLELSIAQKPDWDSRMEKLRAKLLSYPMHRDVTADYLKILEQVSKDSALSLIQRRPDKEKKQQGNLYDLAIECTWEGDLSAIVNFLYALGQQTATMDIDELTISVVPGGKGKMKGNFVLKCAYIRQESGAVPPGTDGTNAPAPPKPAGPTGFLKPADPLPANPLATEK
ncbi:MAG: hypothetical protein HY343_01570 [Lentisphaerae bacterium]|nr:hypothetical protein [Lentisphaerota bacterium]